MKALIAMSGGVDSSVAAALMLKKGYECIGVTMKLYDNDDIFERHEKTCCSLDDIEDARAVARKLGIPYYVFNFKDDFRCKVMDSFVDSYMRGETPNPCIECNRHLKFDGLYRRAAELGCDVIVTGHYARVIYNEQTERYELRCGVDAAKDQSYVLYSLTQEQLKHTCFPLGEYTKEECRQIAEELGFINASKHDSQDICFIPDGDYKKFIEEYTGKTMPPGNFVDTMGNVIGRHTGICNYTIGQRKGLGIAAGKPVFVKEIRPETNEVVISGNDELFTDTLYARDFNWVAWNRDDVPYSCEDSCAAEDTAFCDILKASAMENENAVGNAAGHTVDKNAANEEETDKYNAAGLEVTAKVRYRHNASKAYVSRLSSSEPSLNSSSKEEMVKIVFAEPQRAITKGQAVVLYNGDSVVGGGTICG